MPLRLFRSRNVTGANLVMALLVVGFFGIFFLGALYLQGILGYNPLEVGLAFLPSCLVMGTLSLGYAEKLIMGIGARGALIAGLAFAARGPAAVRARAGGWQLLVDVLPVMLLLGVGRRSCLPGPDDARDVGRDAERLGAGLRASSTRRCRSAARSAWPCSRRSRPSDRRAARRRVVARVGAQLRLPPRLPDRRGADRGHRGR